MKLTKQKNFRISSREARLIEREAEKAGLTESQWLRLIVRAALGETQLLEQLARAAGSSRRMKNGAKSKNS